VNGQLDMMKFFLSIFAFSLLMLSTTSAAKIANTTELIAAMQKKYGKSWYKTATFVQETTNIQPDGTSKVETWYEAAILDRSGESLLCQNASSRR
jgi:outer membrane lipoprotein-sorting protein